MSDERAQRAAAAIRQMLKERGVRLLRVPHEIAFERIIAAEYAPVIKEVEAWRSGFKAFCGDENMMLDHFHPAMELAAKSEDTCNDSP